MINALLTNLSFLNPALLLALLGLPLLYWVLKQIPPAPQRLSFGTLFLLQDIVEKETETNHTPLWLLLFRILIITLVILAFASPMYKKTSFIVDRASPLLVIIDNGWVSAQGWNERKQHIKNLIQENTELKKPVFVLETASQYETNGQFLKGPFTTRDALAYIEQLQPQPFNPAYEKLSEVFGKDTLQDLTEVFYFDDGAISPSERSFLNMLHTRFYLMILTHDETYPFAYLKNVKPQQSFTLQRLYAKQRGVFEVQYIGENGSILETRRIELPADIYKTEVNTQLHDTIRQDLRHIRISGQNHLGANFVLPPQPPRKNIGILTATGDSVQKQNYLDANFYIERALSPFHNFFFMASDTLDLNKINLLFVTDNTLLDESLLEEIFDWVEKGGVVIRYADSFLLDKNFEDTLLPVRLRTTGRHLEGALSWETPQKIESFPETSPLRHVVPNDDIAIQKQVLAEPSLDVSENSWAMLQDGTPLITGKRNGAGWIVLFHISADTSWSNLPLSGMYVSILKEIANLSSSSTAFVQSESIFRLFKRFDAFGRLTDPLGNEIPLADINNFRPSDVHPFGLYEQNNIVVAKNLVPHITDIKGFRLDGKNYDLQNYASSNNLIFKPWLLLIAFVLFILDLLWMISRNSSAQKAIASLVFCWLFGLTFSSSSQALAQNNTALQFSDQAYLAYVITGDKTTDTLSEAGLRGLMNQITRRTSADIGGVIGVNIERDELAFYPLLYWPITSSQTPVSQTAALKIENYFRRGGTILFDTKDQFTSVGSNATINRYNSTLLREITKNINIPPLKPIPENHVLRRSFYLIDGFYGLYNHGSLWISAQTNNQINDGVSPILVGGNDWASAWAVDEYNFPIIDIPRGGERQREMSYRFGINIVMYVLTGNYKDDQVHIPFILERLGQ